MRILNFGSLNLDYVYTVKNIVSPGETVSAMNVQEYCGGKGLNQSVALARAGAEVYHAGMIGSDGGELVRFLKESGVNTAYVRQTEDRTGHTVIQVNSRGQNSIIVYGGANRRIDEDFADGVLEGFGPGDSLLLQNEISCLRHIVDRAYARGIKITLNPSPFNEELLRVDTGKVSRFILNEVEGNQLTGEKDPDKILDEMNRKFPKADVLLTLGKDGSVWSRGAERIWQKAYKVNAVDTTAAGDTFTGYFIAEVARDRKIAEALDMAARASALAVTRNGAAPSIPRIREVLRFEQL